MKAKQETSVVMDAELFNQTKHYSKAVQFGDLAKTLERWARQLRKAEMAMETFAPASANDPKLDIALNCHLN
jgi:hypothetical protein